MALDIQITDKDLPVLSVVATQAIDLLNRANVTNQQLNDLIRQDPALAARVLHIANSPFYGGRCRAQKISEAVMRMGHRQLRNVLLVAATGEIFDATDPHVRAIWDHTVCVANASDKIAGALSLPQAEESFIAGLMHDIGKLVIYRQHPKPYAEVIAESVKQAKRLHVMEEQSFKFFNHMTIGGLVTRKWKLPDAVCETVRHHHQIEQEVDMPLENKALACVVSLANVLVNNHGMGTPVCATGDEVAKLACARELRLDGERLRKISAIVRELCSIHMEPDAQTA